VEKTDVGGQCKALDKGDADVKCRVVTRADVDEVVKLMRLSGFKIAGIATPWLYRTLCREALESGKVLVKVAECNGVVRGFVAAVIDWKAYWCCHLIKHPIFGLRVLWLRLKWVLFGKPVSAVLSPDEESRLTDLIGTAASGRFWAESDRSIAKIVFIYVGPSERGKGVGYRLYQRLFDRLKREGVRRLDARIACANIGSVRLHVQAGFRVEEAGHSLFATLDL
jgi:GNAT superfamily N-acetyltransferase